VSIAVVALKGTKKKDGKLTIKATAKQSAKPEEDTDKYAPDLHEACRSLPHHDDHQHQHHHQLDGGPLRRRPGRRR
jgi:hypothetical protein